MQYSKFHSATALIAFLLCLGLNQPAAALSDSENEALMQQCTIYASRAQKAAQYVTGLGCYPDSGTTSTDYTAHYNFCYQGFINGTMDWAFLQWEEAKRNAMTRSCGYCTGTNTPPGVTPFRKASEDRISNKNIYHCTNDHSRGGPDYSTLAWSDDPKDRFKACLQIFPGDPGTKATFGGRYMPIPPLSADVLEAALEEQLEGSCPAIYAHPEQVRNTCWNFSTKARMIGNWVYNYEGDACFKGQPLGWWKNGQYYDWCIRVYDRVGSDLNALTLEQANSEIENQKETMEAVVDACQAKHQKPIIDDMGNECTPEAHAAGTCVFTATAQVGVMNTRGYAPSPRPLSYNTGVGDITNLKPPPKIGAFTPRGDGAGGGPVASGAGGTGGPGSGGLNPASTPCIQADLAARSRREPAAPAVPVVAASTPCIQADPAARPYRGPVAPAVLVAAASTPCTQADPAARSYREPVAPGVPAAAASTPCTRADPGARMRLAPAEAARVFNWAAAAPPSCREPVAAVAALVVAVFPRPWANQQETSRAPLSPRLLGRIPAAAPRRWVNLSTSRASSSTRRHFRETVRKTCRGSASRARSPTRPTAGPSTHPAATTVASMAPIAAIARAPTGTRLADPHRTAACATPVDPTSD